MPLESWLGYVGTVLVLMSTPGPSHLLMAVNSAAHGLPRALFTAAGDLSANLLQMLAAGLGLAALVAGSGTALAVVKWLGVAYLVWLGVRTIIGRGGRAAAAPRAAHGALFAQGFLTSAANPKAVVFFAALFPQFIAADAPLWPQLAILSASYVVIDACFLGAYGGAVRWAGHRFDGAGARWLRPLSGAALIVAALLLAAKATQRT